MTLAEELADKYCHSLRFESGGGVSDSGGKHLAWRSEVIAAVDEALERAAKVADTEYIEETRLGDMMVRMKITPGTHHGRVPCETIAQRIRQLKSESPDGQAGGPR